MKKFFVLIFLLLTLGFSAEGYAADRSKAKNKGKETCKLISSSEAIRKAKAKSGGKVVSVKLRRAGKRSVYKVRVLVGEKRIRNITVRACR